MREKPSPFMGRMQLTTLIFTQKGLLAVSCVFAVLGTAVSCIPFIAVYGILDVVISGLQSSSWNDSFLLRYGWIACAAAIATVVLQCISLLFSHVGAFKILYELKVAYLQHIAALPLGFHASNPSGKLRKNFDEHIEKLEGFIAHQLPDIVGSLAAPLLTLGILFFFDWRLGLACLAPVLCAYISLIVGYRGKTAKTFIDLYQARSDAMSDASVEFVRGMPVLKACNQTIFSFRRFHATIKEYTDFCLHYTKCFETPMALFLAFINHAYLFLIPVAVWTYGTWENYSTYVLDVLFYIIFSMSLAPAFMRLLYIGHKLNQIQSGLDRINAVFLVKPLPETTQPQLPQSFDIVFDNVSFSYRDDAARSVSSALSNVSFTAPMGAVTALVGPSGCGKTTAAMLVPRFHDVQQGEIRIGGVNIKDISTKDLLSLVSFVFQDVYLFKQSIKENIRMGNPEASDEEIISAAKAAQCHAFIEKLPDGYDTILGAHGVHLSGGERQRLSIARAMLKNAPILILDEATAFADPDNEYLITLALQELTKDKTVIIIAHRLSTVVDAASIIVLNNGRVEEQGTHASLLSAKGFYKQLWDRYSQTLDWQLCTPEKEAPSV